MRIIALLVAVLVVLLIGILMAVKLRRRRADSDVPAAVPDLRVSFPRPGQAIVILPVTASASSPVAARLVDEVAMSVLESFGDAQDVDVRTPTGVLLGSRRRSPSRTNPAFQSALRSERSPAPTAPLLPRRPPAATASARKHLPVPRSLADQLELPAQLRAGLADPNDPVDIVEQLLRVAGHRPDRTGNLLRLDGHTLVVLRVPVGSRVPREELDRASAQFDITRSPRGLVVAPGYFPSREIARRQVIDPDLQHAGLRDLQRMADAAAAGMDPLAFAMPPRATPAVANGDVA